MTNRPLIRPLDFQPVYYEDQQMWLLRDPLELTDYQLILSPALAQLLVFFDGERDLTGIQAAFKTHFGAQIDMKVIKDTVAQLDEACLLENERYQTVLSEHLEAYRALPNRPPSLAGTGYPADPKELMMAFQKYGEGDELDGWQPWQGRGIISPHIDYYRGGPVYAKTWRRAEAAVREADLVLIFGTDHSGSAGRITLTEKPYATPYGTLPTDLKVIASLAKAIGPDVFGEELHHRKEHSIELSAVWLHHVAGPNPPPMIPILCGSFHHFIANGHHPDDDPIFNTFIETLQRLSAGKRVLAVASVDLAHVGPSFGDNFTMNDHRRQELLQSDAHLMAAIARGDADRFYTEIAVVEDRNRICGFSSIYLLLRFLGQAEGRVIAYEHCPADQEDASLVSICGMLLD